MFCYSFNSIFHSEIVKIGLLHKIRYFVFWSFRYESQDQCCKSIFSKPFFFLYRSSSGIMPFVRYKDGSLYFERTVQLSEKMEIILISSYKIANLLLAIQRKGVYTSKEESIASNESKMDQFVLSCKQLPLSISRRFIGKRRANVTTLQPDYNITTFLCIIVLNVTPSATRSRNSLC